MIALIAAMARNRVIGKDGKIPWDLPQDRQYFRDLTMGQAVVMGRRTYEEIGYPLPGRLTIVVSSTMDYQGEGLLTVSSLEEAISAADGHDVFIAGGTCLYAEALPLADFLYLTEIDADYEGDTLFPEFAEEEYIRTVRQEIKGDPSFRFVVYERRHRD
ncbi:MAG: dihydrofolate reductase [Solobacterium sp.]|nr:dihydrofolate reductase [Solobacterium sp.]